MYTAFYGLREKPFSLSPDPRFLFVAEAHREALAHLRYGLDQSEGFMAITGEVGTGKTTICRTLLAGLEDDTEVAFLFNPPQGAIELLQSIALEFGLEPAGDQRHALNNQLNQFLLERKRQGRRVLLIIDEAQNLDEAILEEVRLLSNLETASSKLIQILLLGQPELDAKLDSDGLRQLRQRISVRWHLAPLTRPETRAYVAHRLAIAAGAERDIFSSGALDEIHRRSGGVPRRINLLCDRVLLEGYASKNHRLSKKQVTACDREISRAHVVGARRARRGANWKGIAGWSWQGIATAAALVCALLLGYGGGQFDQLRSRVGAGSEPAPVSVSMMLPEFDIGFDKAFESGGVTGDTDRASQDVTRGDAPAQGVSGTTPGQLAASAAAVASQAPVPKRPLGTRGERVLNTLAPGSYLGRLLDQMPIESSRQQVVNAMLDTFGLSFYEVAPQNDDEIFSMLEQRGLALLDLESGDFEAVLALNYPVILLVETEDGAERLVALASLDGEVGAVYGAREGGALDVPFHLIEQQWSGIAYVVWEPYEPIPALLLLGHQGRGVAWLQNALSELGYYSGDNQGLFDRDTEDSVIEFQRARQIQADGAVGPRTQMLLYEMLDRYDVPRLERRNDTG